MINAAIKNFININSRGDMTFVIDALNEKCDDEIKKILESVQ